MRLQSAATVFVFALASTASAATYYVAPTGNDAANGSISTPFRTISKGAATARPGDVVNVRGGVYNEIVRASVKGTADARITIQSHPGETAVIDGNGTAAATDLVQLGSAEYLDFKGFEVRNATRLAIAGWGSKNLRILNNKVHHAYKGGIYVGHSGFGTTYDITIDGNTVYNNATENQYHTMNGGWGQSISVQYVDRATISNNRVYQNDGEGIVVLLSDNVLVTKNEVSDSFSVGIYLDNAQSTTVDGNFVYSTNDSRYFRGGHPAAGISMANESYSSANPLSANRIVNNIVVNSKWGLHYGNYEAGGGVKNTVVSNNTFHRATVAMVWFDADAHSGNTVQNNIFAQSGGGVMHGGSAAGTLFRSNNWYGGNANAAAGAGDVIGNPLLVNAGGLTANDYRLQQLSPAIHTALDATDVTTDFWGNARTPTFDIGAHEQSLAIGTSAPIRPPLEAPFDFRAVAAGPESAQLVWSAALGATSYRVYRDRELIATVDKPLYLDGSLAAGTTYSYAVSSVGADGEESAPSANVAVTTADDPAPTTTRRRAARK